MKIVVMGASAGGIPAVKEALETFPDDIAVFLVLHLSKRSNPGIIANILQKRTVLNCMVAVDGDTIKSGNLYIAPLDRHMIVKENTIRIINGPHENRWRPSIDVLFRSAAVAHGPHVIGIILTGMLDDGTSGMYAIRQCGGLTIVQDPEEAEFSSMPDNVLKKMSVDHTALIQNIGAIVKEHRARAESQTSPVPDELRIETEITENMVSSIDQLKRIGEHSDYTCPDCGGELWKIKKDGIDRYRCFTGHVYNKNILVEKQSESLEDSLWILIRRMEEHTKLLSTDVDEGTASQLPPETKKGEIIQYIDQLKAMISGLSEY